MAHIILIQMMVAVSLVLCGIQLVDALPLPPVFQRWPRLQSPKLRPQLLPISLPKLPYNTLHHKLPFVVPIGVPVTKTTILTPPPPITKAEIPPQKHDPVDPVSVNDHESMAISFDHGKLFAAIFQLLQSIHFNTEDIHEDTGHHQIHPARTATILEPVKEKKQPIVGDLLHSISKLKGLAQNQNEAIKKLKGGGSS